MKTETVHCLPKLLLIALSGVALGQRCAYAGHCERHYECVGSDSPKGYSGGTQAWPSPVTSESVRATNSGSDEPGSVRSEGTITAVFTWTPDFQGDFQQPPAEALFKESSEASAYSAQGSTITASNGLGDAAVPDNTNAPFVVYMRSTGVRVTKVVTAGATTIRLPGRFLSGVAGDRPTARVYRGADLTYRADPITIRIRRNGRDISNQFFNAQGTTVSEDVIVGERIRLSAEVNALGMTVSNEHWVVPEKRIYDFVAGQNLGTVFGIGRMEGSSANFCWVDGGNMHKTVAYHVTIGGVSVTAQAMFNVDKPNVPVTVTQAPSPVVDADYHNPGWYINGSDKSGWIRSEAFR